MIKIENVKCFFREDSSGVKRYSCEVKKNGKTFFVKMETDGVFQPHISKQEFIKAVKIEFNDSPIVL